MTPSQKRVREAVAALTADYGHPPTFQEIADACGFSSIATVHKHVQALLRQGLLYQRDHNAHRSLSLTPQGPVCVISGFERDIFCPGCKGIIPAWATHRCYGSQSGSITKAA